jgi:hypothetical protein
MKIIVQFDQYFDRGSLSKEGPYGRGIRKVCKYQTTKHLTKQSAKTSALYFKT